MPQDFKKNFFNFWTFRVIGPFEILSRYPNIDGSHSFSEDIQWTIDKVFREKTYGLNGFNTFFPHFSTDLLVFDCICCFFNSPKIYYDVLFITYE